jgi:peptidoglycan L-alanyl-D-glutamate endopeptidase CwlK
MPQLSALSIQRLATCDLKLQRLIEEVIKHYDVSVSQGHRGEAEQRLAFRQGQSRCDWPDSKHNSLPSLAVDILPYNQTFRGVPTYKDEWDILQFSFLGGIVLSLSWQLGISVRWGYDWNQNNYIVRDQKLNDGPHFELT